MYRVVQCRNDLILAGEEVRPGQIRRNRVVCDEAAIHRQVLYESLQLFQHFLLRQRIEFSPLRLLQKRRAGKQGQSAGSDKRAYEDVSQNALWRYMLEYFVRRYSELAKEKVGTGILDTQLAYSIRFYCMGAVGMTQEWVLKDNITSAETVVQMMFASMPENMRTVLF